MASSVGRPQVWQRAGRRAPFRDNGTACAVLRWAPVGSASDDGPK